MFHCNQQRLVAINEERILSNIKHRFAYTKPLHSPLLFFAKNLLEGHENTHPLEGHQKYLRCCKSHYKKTTFLLLFLQKRVTSWKMSRVFQKHPMFAIKRLLEDEISLNVTNNRAIKFREQMNVT